MGSVSDPTTMSAPLDQHTVRWRGRLMTGLAVVVRSPPPRAGRASSVPRAEILEAMRHSEGYALTATANGPRLQAEVVLSLVRQAAANDAGRQPLYLGHEEWFLAFQVRALPTRVVSLTPRSRWGQVFGPTVRGRREDWSRRMARSGAVGTAT